MIDRYMTACARELGALVNRVVFVAGDAAATSGFAGASVCTPRQAPPELHLVPSGSSMRLAAEFATVGFTVSERRPTHDTWVSTTGVIAHVAVPSSEPEGDWAIVTEYATLLTSAVDVGLQAPLRITSAVVQLAYLGALHRLARSSLIVSGAAEQFTRLVLDGVVDREQLAAAPPELRAIIARNAAYIGADSALGFLLHRLVRGARTHGSARAIAMPRLAALLAS